MLLRSQFLRTLFFPAFIASSIVIISLSLFAAARVHSIRYESQQRAFQDKSRLAYALIADDLQNSRFAALEEKLRSIAVTIGCRITLVADGGEAIAETQADSDDAGNFRLRPEIVEAGAIGEGRSTRYSRTLGEEIMYLAHREQQPDGKRYFMRLAIPVAKLTGNTALFDWTLAVATLCAITVAGLVSYGFARRHAAAATELSETARALAAGEYDRRTHPETIGELKLLGESLNTLGNVLIASQSEAVKGKAELMAVLTSMSDGLIATDGQQRIRFCNPACGKLLEFSPAPSMNKLLFEVVQNEEILQAAGKVLGSREAITVEFSQRGRHLQVALSPLSHEGMANGLLILVRDTTQAVQYLELRKEFVANVSHELRTPLTFIKGFVETLRDGAVSDPQKAKEYLGIIEKHVAQLTNLVDDLLQISKLESHTTLARRVNVNLGDTIRRVVGLMEPAAQKKGQTVSVDLANNLPAVYGDSDYLDRAVTNLVHNAIKYTPEKGTISVSAKYSNDRVIVEVADTGIGIPQSDMARIFERFYRVDKSRSREMGGTGLGLAIVKHIVQVHGGTVEVSSEPGKGSCFRMMLPVIDGTKN